MIFLEEDFSPVSYRSAASRREWRSCNRDPSGQFAPANDCAGDGSSSTSTVSIDDRWKNQEGEINWDEEDLSSRPPVKGGEVLDTFQITDVGSLKSAMAATGVDSLDDIAQISGGLIRKSSLSIMSFASEISAVWVAPVDPKDDTKGFAQARVIFTGNPGGEKKVHYDYFDLDASPRASEAEKRRVASLLIEKFADSMKAAEKAGVDVATTSAAGKVGSREFMGYRLWPQFGFDGVLPSHVMDKIPHNILNATKVSEQSLASGHMTLQELISTRAGERWWDENGETISLSFYFKDKNSLGYRRFSKMAALAGRMKGKGRNEGRSLYDILFWGAERRDCGRDPDGQFGDNNKCQEGAGEGQQDGVATLPRARNVDVMLGGGEHVAVIDAAIRARALEDTAANPKPADSHPGSATDLWDRTFVRREGDTKTKITSSDPVFPRERMVQGGSYVAHEDIGQFLSARHEESRNGLGGTTGPTAIIDTTEELPEKHFDYLVDALKDDAVHAYEVGGYEPGFYSTDLHDAMGKMSALHPEIQTDDNSRFLFTMLTAITSNGQDPNTNLVDADALYTMWKQSGTVVPAAGQSIGAAGEESEEDDAPGVGGARDIRKSLVLLQSMIDSFGVERTRRLLSGYTTVERLNKTLQRMSERSGDPEWLAQNGGEPWMTDHYSDRTKSGEPKASTNLVKQGAGKTGSVEFPDEVVPMAAIFGPKIGSFYANLSGRHDFLTMDRWLMRSVGRVTGELITRTTPKSAKEAAEKALTALEASRSRKLLFGLDRPPHNLTKADIVRSLKIQKRTGVVEEHGAAYLWAARAAASYKKTPKPGGGSFGKHPDPDIDAAHKAANPIFKSLVKEQQTPRGAQARRNLRNVFREIVRRIEEEYPERKGQVDVDEVQAVLWQYEKNLWKHLGGFVKIDKNSLYSKAADKLLARKSRKVLRPEARAVGGLAASIPLDYGDDTGIFSPEQLCWDNDIAQSGIDFLELFAELEKGLEEERSFCPTGPGGGVDNSCSSTGSAKSAVAERLKSARTLSGKQKDVARKINQMESSEKQIEQLVRDLGGDLKKTLIDIEATRGNEGLNIFVRDKEENENFYVHFGYYGATIYPTDKLTAEQERDVTAAAQKAFPSTISNRLWKRGQPYPIAISYDYDHSSPGFKSGKETHRAFCPTGDGGGVDNSCGSQASGGMRKAKAGEPGISSSWLSPSGEFHPVARTNRNGDWNTHHSYAVESGISGGEPELLSKGWMRVVEIGDELFAANESGKPLTQKQLKSLKDHAIISGKSSIVHEGRVGTKIVWSKDERSFCPTGDGGGVENSRSSSDQHLKERIPFSPIGDVTNSEHIRVPTHDELTEALTGSNSSKGTKIGAAKDLPAGTPVALRIDIPAFNYSSEKMGKAIYAVTVHEDKGGKGFGSPIGYEPMARLSGDVVFASKEGSAAKIASGDSAKFPLATAKGKFDPSREIPSDIDSWTAVGYDPKKAAYFYDKKTGKEVTGGTDALSVGNSVFVRVPKYGNRVATHHYRHADFWGIESRAYCATGEGNGIDNSCSSEDGGAAALANSGSANVSWESGDGDPPFKGAEKFQSVSVSSPDEVGKSLTSMRVSPSEALSIAGTPEGGSHAFVRPSPEFKSDRPFKGSGVMPIFIDVERDVAGVKNGLQSSSVLGFHRRVSTGENELVIWHNTMTVSDKIRSDDALRHLAAREFYRTMVSSVEAARKAGVTTVLLNAAGHSGASAKGNANPWKGYTIWPRMGFDAPLPPHVIRALPAELSHARTLLDLHATREGTRWWAQNGEDLDVMLDLRDRGSPQNKIFDRFVRHFGSERREMPFGSGDDWLSPEDLTRLGEMWDEIWDDDGLLDDYSGEEQEFIQDYSEENEARAFCATGTGNGIDNSCSSASGGSSTAWGGGIETWGRDTGSEVWTPSKPLFRGAQKIGSIQIARAKDVKEILRDGLRMDIADAVLASGPVFTGSNRPGLAAPRLTITPVGHGVEMHWHSMGSATGSGFKDAPDFADRPGTAVKAVEASRDIWITKGGPVLHMGGFFVHPDYQGQGIALESVLHSTSAPVSRLEMDAERFDHPNPKMRMTGYKVWPKFGYDAPISAVKEALAVMDKTLPPHLSKAKTLSDIYSTPGGEEWWAENGMAIRLVFDMRPRSRSRVTLLDLQSRKSKKSRSVPMQGDPKEIGCDSDRDETVDEFWAEVQRDGKTLGGSVPTQEEWDRWAAESREAKDGNAGKVQPH